MEMTNKDSFLVVVMSFREKLIGGSSKNVMEEDEELMSKEEEDGDYDEEMDADCLTIKLTKEEEIRIRRPWRRTLIIKLLGENIGYNLHYRKILELWKPTASVDLVAIDNGFFLAWISSEEDYEFTKYEGPWMIFNHYLTVRQMAPQF